MENVEVFSPDERLELQRVITEAVMAALSAFTLGRRRLGHIATAANDTPRLVFLDTRDRNPGSINPTAEWRKAASQRYAAGTWKRSLAEVVPLRRFRASEVVQESGERLQAEHPTHHHIGAAIANTLKGLVDDGIVAKVAPGVYAPAIDGVSLA
ncbi:hypothetical protein EPN42_01535 [bacterium]|nr:MAG: hypothetical protein EPN42_01535 [bacterium]